MKKGWTEHPHILGLLGTLFILSLVVLYALEFRYFDRTLGFGRLLGWSLPVGAVLGGLLGYRFQRQGRERLERIQIYVFFIVLCTLFAPLFASLSNRLLSWRSPRPVAVEFAGTDPRYASRFGLTKDEVPEANQYHLFFYRDDRLHRIKTEAPRFPEAEQGDTVVLNMKRGLWGFDIVQ